MGFIAFASRDYFLMLLLLAFSRGMDLLSTWVGTPNLVLEGNPVARFLGWRWGILANIALCFGMAFWPPIAIAFSTFGLLVASRHFQDAWVMRSLGEERFRVWRTARIRETPIVLFLACLAGQTLLIAAIGVAVIFFGINPLLNPRLGLIRSVALLSIGMGIVFYALIVAFYTMIGVWRLRRPARHKSPALPAAPAILLNGGGLKTPLADSCACEPSDFPGK